MDDQKEWARATAIRRIEQRAKDDPGMPMSRIYSEVAGYVGVRPAEVEGWWKGRMR